MGPATEEELAELPGYQDYVYDDPEFTWEKVVAPTGLSFGAFHEIDEYDNSLFVGDCNTGNLYRFELNEDRDGFEFSSSFLQDNMVNKNESMDEIVIGTGFGCITDIERGPDGFLYVVSLSESAIYRILPGNNAVDSEDGGCLVATATYGSELSPEVQKLREIRDNTLLQTESGTNFMNSFNEFYYTFSPSIADYERENPAFREMVKLSLTPMLSTLPLMEYADSESSVVTIGVSLIVLNGLMYVGIPAIAIVGVRKI